MLKLEWAEFAERLRAKAVADAARWSAVEKELGISHARLIDATKGKPVGTEIFLTLCKWMKENPFFFCHVLPPAIGEGPYDPRNAIGAPTHGPGSPNPSPHLCNLPLGQRVCKRCRTVESGHVG